MYGLSIDIFSIIVAVFYLSFAVYHFRSLISHARFDDNDINEIQTTTNTIDSLHLENGTFDDHAVNLSFIDTYHQQEAPNNIKSCTELLLDKAIYTAHPDKAWLCSFNELHSSDEIIISFRLSQLLGSGTYGAVYDVHLAQQVKNHAYNIFHKCLFSIELACLLKKMYVSKLILCAICMWFTASNIICDENISRKCKM